MNESTEITERNQPCADEDCGSSDAMQVYSDGHGFCFSCQTHFKKSQLEKEDDEVLDLNLLGEVDAPKQQSSSFSSSKVAEGSFRFRGFRDRGITKPVTTFYGVKSLQSASAEILEHWYPYYSEDGSEVVCNKIRKLPKTFTSEPAGVTPPELFGQRLFPAKGKRIIVTEGELDALAIAQAQYTKYERFYPVVSLPLGAGSAKKQLSKHLQYLRSFDEVVIWFDNDEQGEKAVKEACKIIGADKVKIVSSGEKDANDVLLRSGWEGVMRCIWDAESWKPAQIMDTNDIWKEVEEYAAIEAIPYPPCLTGLNDKVKGMRRGEITLFTSGTGSGKSTMMREIMYHLLNNHDDAKIGIVSLEESAAETARSLAGLAINKNPAKDEIPLDELKEGFDKVFGSGKVMLLKHEDCTLGEDILEYMDYMAVMGCTHLFLDHITILTSEGFGEVTGNEATDKAMNNLSRMVKRRNVWIGLISHIRKMGESGKSFEDGVIPTLDDIRGSGSIKQICYDVLGFARNLNSENAETRNTIRLAVLKSRYTGLTGPAGKAKYDYHTGRLKHEAKSGNLSVEDDVIVEI
jgi:twinkle protein